MSLNELVRADAYLTVVYRCKIERTDRFAYRYVTVNPPVNVALLPSGFVTVTS